MFRFALFFCFTVSALNQICEYGSMFHERIYGTPHISKLLRLRAKVIYTRLFLETLRNGLLSGIELQLLLHLLNLSVHTLFYSF